MNTALLKLRKVVEVHQRVLLLCYKPGDEPGFFCFLIAESSFRGRRKAFHSLICIEIYNIQITKIQQLIMNKKSIFGWIIFGATLAILSFIGYIAKQIDDAPISIADDDESEATVNA